VLSEILAALPMPGLHRQLLVGVETADDAAVYRLNDSQALVATTDFFTPIVDDPYDFGRIAATNALADVYAMGGKPIMALAIAGMPLDKLPTEAIRRILQGGESICAQAGIPIAGGHSIDTREPIYGLAALGLVHPDKLKRNSTAGAGDALVLGKPIGIGILSAALKKGRLSDAGYAALLECTTKLNTPGEALGSMPEVHAMTDVTGFRLAGHLLEMCRGAGLSAELSLDSVPTLPEAIRWAKQGLATGASNRNWQDCGKDVELPDGIPEWQRTLLFDPQTSGGLLVACSAKAIDRVLGRFFAEGFASAAVVGFLHSGPPKVRVGVG
jgi:selenide,water dikinase